MTTTIAKPAPTGAKKHIITAIAAVLLCLCAVPAQALNNALYADSSRLSTGRWYKVSVNATGVYAIKPATLRKWGFSNPANVRVYGYGAQRIPDALTAANYVDDLPMAPMKVEADGTVVFFAQGPETWTQSSSSYYYGGRNIFTDKAYYYLRDTAEEIAMATTATPGAAAPATHFTERIHHEQDINTPGEAGGMLVGEDFRFTPSRTFTFDLPGRTDAENVWFQCSFVARTLGANSRLTFTVNDKVLDSKGSDVIDVSSTDGHYHGKEAITTRDIPVSGKTLRIGIRHSSSGTVYGAWLNYITVNYQRRLSLTDDKSGALLFHTNATELSLADATEGTEIWDVTQGAPARRVQYSLDDGTAKWTSSYGATRRYVAWQSGAKLSEPRGEGAVANQNLHADAAPDMLIICPRLWIAQAERLAELRRSEGLTVLVRDPQEIYNEFSSGAADIGGLRRYAKMLYDRGKNAGGNGLQYILLMARGTYDNRHSMTTMADAAPTLPAWYGGSMQESLSDTDGFGTDDFLAMLEDNSGANKGSDRLSVAVGRIPSTSVQTAKQYIDKLIQYSSATTATGWENQMLLLADDEDSGEHLDQAEALEGEMLKTDGQPFMVNKVYLDAYTKTNGNYPAARTDMFRHLNEGSVWWTFIGHANNHSMTGDGQLTYNDINNNMYFKRVPVLYAATCDFLRWDSQTESGGEILFNERYGGAIAVISATRPVWIFDNRLFNLAMGRALGKRDSDGRILPLGKIYQNAKNDIRSLAGVPTSNTNRLRFVLMGDPSMRLATPNNIVRLDSLNGVAIGGDEDAVAMGLSVARFAGSVTGPQGYVLTDFDGTVTATVYDAERSVVSNGNGENGVQSAFDMHGTKLMAGSAKVEGGRFVISLALPAEIEDNYRPALINMYATANGDSTGNVRRAIGLEKRFYIYGIDENGAPDTEKPVVHSMYLNTAEFRNGDIVNTSPMFIAELSDDRGINLSESGMSGKMCIILDGNKRYNDVAQYYTPSTTDAGAGTVRYPFSDLQPGTHTLEFRVWDTSGNSTFSTLDFGVGTEVPVKTFRLYATPNPASTEASFYVIHDRPDQLLTVNVTVYDLLGHQLWQQSVTGIGDMVKSTPLTWGLTDGTGRRVPRGIYLYRATVAVPGEPESDSGTQRIAVTD